MSNSFNIDVSPAIADAVVKILANKTILDDIHNTELPAVLIEIQNNQALLLNVDSIVDTIKLKTDATPQNVRGKYMHANLSADNPTFQNVVNVTGHGKIDHISFLVDSPDDTGELRLEIDGEAAMDLSLLGDNIEYNVVPSPRQIDNSFLFLHTFPYLDSEVVHFNMEFSSSLLLQIRRSSGTTAMVRCKIIYTLDQF
ncbi:hypothetical protein ES705_50185 [subsurface metagenome]